MRRLPTFIQSATIDEHWLKNVEKTARNKLLFRNGYYDFEKLKFHKEFNPSLYFHHALPFDYDLVEGEDGTEYEEEDWDYMMSIRERIFYSSMGEKAGQYFLESIACALGGRFMKRVLFGLGNTDCGKSILTYALQQSLGKYVGNFNGECLSNRDSSQEESQKLRWALLERHSRICISNEMKNDTILNGQMIKKISGGDTLTARLMAKNETNFTIDFLPICFMNDIPDITPYDNAVDNRLRLISFEKTFVENPLNEFERKRDDNIKSEIETERFQKAMVALLLYTYNDIEGSDFQLEEPEEVRNAKANWVGEEKKLSTNLFDNDFFATDK